MWRTAPFRPFGWGDSLLRALSECMGAIRLLIDQQGRIMFKPSVHDADTRIVLERQVEALLNRARP